MAKRKLPPSFKANQQKMKEGVLPRQRKKKTKKATRKSK